MSVKLSILIILSMIGFLYIILKDIKKGKLLIKNSILWIILVIFVIIVTLRINHFTKIANLIGIEKASNMVFFLGFIFLLILTFNFSKKISEQNNKLLKLAQEIALIKKEKKEEDGK